MAPMGIKAAAFPGNGYGYETLMCDSSEQMSQSLQTQRVVH